MADKQPEKCRRKRRNNGVEVESLTKELGEEKEKVRNLTTWKSQLMEKNKELKEDNAR